MSFQSRRAFLTTSMLAPLGLALSGAAFPRARAAEPQSRDLESEYVIGKSNATAHAAALQIAHNRYGSGLSPLLFTAGRGMGKTTLLDIIELKMRNSDPDVRIYRTSGKQLMTSAAFQERMEKCDAFLIDDFDDIAEGVAAQEEFLRIYKYHITHANRFVATGSLSWKSLKRLSPDIKFRMEVATKFRIHRFQPDDRLKIATRTASRYGLRAQSDILQLITERSATDLHQIEKDVRRLNLHFGSRSVARDVAEALLIDV